MKRIGLLATVPACVGAIALGVSHPTAQRVGSPQTLVPVNALPNPYRTVENYFKLPAGRTWGATSAVAVDTDGKSIWVAERCGANSCAGSPLPPILHFDAQGNLLTAFGAGMFVAPHGIYVDRDGNVWAIDCACTGGGGRGRAAGAATDPAAPPPSAAAPASAPPPTGHQIYKFSPDGTRLMTLGKPGGGREPDFFWQPNAIAIARDGTIFVSEGHSSAAGSTARVLKFSKDGRLLQSFGTLGTGPDEFDQPHALAIDSKGRLFVGDRNNNRIQILDQDFQLLDTWRQFSRPSGIYIDKNDVIYVADSESESISRNAVAHPHEGWKRGIRIGSAKDGSVKYFIPDPVDTATNTSAAEGVAADAAGNVYGAEVGPRVLKRYVK